MAEPAQALDVANAGVCLPTTPNAWSFRVWRVEIAPELRWFLRGLAFYTCVLWRSLCKGAGWACLQPDASFSESNSVNCLRLYPLVRFFELTSSRGGPMLTLMAA